MFEQFKTVDNRVLLVVLSQCVFEVYPSGRIFLLKDNRSWELQENLLELSQRLPELISN